MSDVVTDILRSIATHFVMPIFNDDTLRSYVAMKDPDGAGKSPFAIADIGVQILLARELAGPFPGETVIGEENVPRLTKAQAKIVRDYDLTKPLSLDRCDARAFIEFLSAEVQKNTVAPKKGIELYLSGKGFLADPIDGTIPFLKKDPRFSMQVARFEAGRVTAGWILRPAEGVLFRRIGDEYPIGLRFENGNEQSIDLFPPSLKPFSEMKIAYPHAHSGVLLDEATRPVYTSDGRRLSFEEVKTRLENSFKEVVSTDGYSYHIGEVLLGRLDAFGGPGTFPWDHFAEVFIAQGLGYRIGFFDGQDYLGPKGEIPFVLDPKGAMRVPHSGGVLYAHPEIWDDLNQRLNGDFMSTTHTQRCVFRLG